MHDNTLTEDNRDKFNYIAGRYGQTIKFYNVEKICADEIENIKSSFPSKDIERFSVGAYFRMFLPKIFSDDINKIIYLDADIIVNLDITELWRIELGDKPLAAVPEKNDIFRDLPVSNIWRKGFMKAEDYFNSGVLLINLEIWRIEKEIIFGSLKLINENKFGYAEQDALNYCFSKDYLKLPMKFNCWVNDFRSHGITKIERNIYHFLDRQLRLDIRDNYNRLFMKYFIQTPFFDEDSIGRLYAGIRNI